MEDKDFSKLFRLAFIDDIDPDVDDHLIEDQPQQKTDDVLPMLDFSDMVNFSSEDFSLLQMCEFTSSDVDEIVRVSFPEEEGGTTQPPSDSTEYDDYRALGEFLGFTQDEAVKPDNAIDREMLPTTLPENMYYREEALYFSSIADTNNLGYSQLPDSILPLTLPTTISDIRKLRVRHSSSQKLTQSVRCNYCHKIFACDRYAIQHIRAKHPEYLIDCEICGKKLFTYEKYQMHIVRHTLRKTILNCPYCEAKFTDHGHKKRHIHLQHRGGTKYYCHMCPKMFCRLGNLENHLKTHRKTSVYGDY